MVGGPDWRRRVRGGFESEAGIIEPGVIRRPCQNNSRSGACDGQLWGKRKTEYRAAIYAVPIRRPIQGVA